MSQEIHVTRGAAFGEAGADQITLQQWRDALARELQQDDSSKIGRFARLHGSPVVFNDGVIAAVSPSSEAFESLRALARALHARIFGEDGVEYGLTTLQEVRRTVADAFPGGPTAPLDDRLAQQLVIVSEGDPRIPSKIRERAFVACCRLGGDEAKTALTYLVCRAVESGGHPPSISTCVVAHLRRHDPERVQSLRQPPIEEWIDEVESLAKLLEKKPGAYVIRTCHQCGAKNRTALFAPADQQPKCGRCKSALA